MIVLALASIAVGLGASTWLVWHYLRLLKTRKTRRREAVLAARIPATVHGRVGAEVLPEFPLDHVWWRTFARWDPPSPSPEALRAAGFCGALDGRGRLTCRLAPNHAGPHEWKRG